MKRAVHTRILGALLVAGSAVSFMACGTAPKASEVDDEKVISRTVVNMETMSSENGTKKQVWRARLVEEHAFARPAFEEYPEGMEVIGYDSIGAPSSRVVADYALHWTERDLWELNGNVIVEGEEGQKLYTQQLRWDRKIKKIYSNVDCKVEEGGDVLYGVGFDAADDFSKWTFLGVTGTVGVNVEPTADSTAVNGSGNEVDGAAGQYGVGGVAGVEEAGAAEAEKVPALAEPIPAPELVPASTSAPTSASALPTRRMVPARRLEGGVKARAVKAMPEKELLVDSLSSRK